MDADRTVLVVGAGVAGLTAALACAAGGLSVTVVARGGVDASNSYAAQGGIAAAIGPDDEPARHAADTLAVARGLAHPDRVRILTEGAADAIAPLLDAGVLVRQEDGSPALALEAGHSRRRIVHAAGGLTGRAVTAFLDAAARKQAAIHWAPGRAVDLLRHGDRVVGARIAPAAGGVPEPVFARAVVLATGGFAGLYPVTSNPPHALGDGLILAWRAGAPLADLELMQFHPTVLADPRHPGILISEAVRGAGAHLVDRLGRRILASHPARELAPRDEVARAVESHRPVYLSLGHLAEDDLRAEFGGLATLLAGAGWDLAHDLLPVEAGAHFAMGGVMTDPWGATGVPGLWAVGECAMTGVHGANRLASNSLLEGLVFGARAAQAISAAEVGPAGTRVSPDCSPPGYWVPPAAVRRRLGEALGVVREGAFIADLQADLEALPPTAARDLARMAAAAAAAREESRGAHFRRDFPEPVARLRGHFVHQRESSMRFLPWSAFEAASRRSGRQADVHELLQ